MALNVGKIASALGASVLFGIGSAQAEILVNDWTLDLTGVDGLGATVITGIDQITFTGIASAKQDNDDGVINVGDTGTATGLLSANSFLHDGGIISMTGLNNNFEFTFTFTAFTQTIAVDGLNSNQTHLPGGTISMYIDNFANGGTVANQTTGAGYDDGVLIATFTDDGGNGGVFNALTFNGSDDAVWTLTDLFVPGVLLDADGNALGLGTKLVSASQFDADFNNDGIPDVTAPASLGCGPTFSPTSFCAQEDGRASLLQQVPEPASLALVGLALAGLGVTRRNRKQ